MTVTTVGKRIHGVDKRGDGKLWFAPESGAYWFDRTWMAVTPNGLLGNLSNHDVTEHEDGTISVSPSILVEGGWEHARWHGYLEHGVWREV